MGGRRRLRGGFVRFLSDHRSHDGVAFRRYIKAAVEIVGVTESELVRGEIRRYAVAGVAYDRAAHTWAAAISRRETGRGRRPSDRAIERAARRLGLADSTLKDAVARLEELAQKRRRPATTIEELLAVGSDRARTMIATSRSKPAEVPGASWGIPPVGVQGASP